jgi:hypothetical protein
MRQMEMGGRSLFAGAAAAALLWSLVFIGIGTAVARAATLPVDVGGWTPAAAGISKAPEAKNSNYGGTLGFLWEFFFELSSRKYLRGL